MRLYRHATRLTIWTMLLCTGLITFNAANAQSTTDPEELFKKALQKRSGGELVESIEAFQSILGIEPALHRARLELATSYFQAMNYAEARRQAQRVLADPATPEAVKENIRRFLSEIAAADIRHTFSPYVHLGMLYDSNVNSGPDRSTFQNIQLAPGSTKEHDQAVTLSAGLSHRYLAPTTMKLGRADTAFVWNSNIGFYGAHYDKNDEFNLDVFSAGTGPGWIIANQWRGGINLQLDASRLGDKRYATYASLNPSLTRILNGGRTELTGDISVQKRDFHRTSETGRDSNYASIGVSVGQVVGLTTAIQAGARYFDERADLDYFNNKGYEVFVGANWQVSDPFSVYGRLGYRDSQFDAPEPALPIAREEQNTTFLLGASYRISGSFLDKWLITANYTYSDNRGNVGPYVFEREKISLTFGRAF